MNLVELCGVRRHRNPVAARRFKVGYVYLGILLRGSNCPVSNIGGGQYHPIPRKLRACAHIQKERKKVVIFAGKQNIHTNKAGCTHAKVIPCKDT